LELSQLNIKVISMHCLKYIMDACVNSLIWSKGSTEKQSAVRTSSTRRQPAWKISLKVDTREARERSGSRVLARLGELARRLTRRRFAARFFDQRQTFIIATPQETFKSEIATRLLLEMSVFSRHVQTTFFLQTLWFREWTRRWSEVKFLSTVGDSVNKENPQQTISSAQYFIPHTKSQQSKSLCHPDGHATLHDRNMQCSFLLDRALVVSRRSRRQSRHPHRVSHSWRWLWEHTSKFLLDLIYLLRMTSLR